MSELKDILVIDDENFWRATIAKMVSRLGFTCKSVGDFEEAIVVLDQAEANNQLFDIAIIDVNFQYASAGQTIFTPYGIQLLPDITEKYPYLGRVIITGASHPHHYILDLRDEYDIDYYIHKNTLTEEVLHKGFQRAIARAQQRNR